jgi:ribosomal protein S18 acetylase RimI-like enzyme
MAIAIRQAALEDDVRLVEIDRATWSGSITPSACRSTEVGFFDHGLDPHDVLVAELDRITVGYAKLGAPTPLASNRHVLDVQGLAVLPGYRRRGIGRQLIGAAINEAAARGVRRLRLRVLASNPIAQQFYASLGFEMEGILREEFLIDGRYVDDVLMVIWVDRHDRFVDR